MDAIIKDGIYAQRRAKSIEDADILMARTCNECNIKHVGHCYCDRGYICYVESEHDKKVKQLEELKKPEEAMAI